jgi:G3E family GTPase
VLVIETSGLSDPIAIAEMLQAAELRDKVYLSHIWCIIDAENYFKIRKIQSARVEHQIRIADTVLINKSDLQEKTGDIMEDIKKLNPYAKTKPTTYCNIELGEIPEFNKVKPVALQQQEANKSFESCGRPDIQSAVLRTTKKISRKGLENFLKYYAPKTYRLKGYVMLKDDVVVAVQSTFGNFEVRGTGNTFSGTMLIAMGEDVNIAEMNREYKKQLKQ